jgi:hypothetical protein
MKDYKEAMRGYVLAIAQSSAVVAQAAKQMPWYRPIIKRRLQAAAAVLGDVARQGLNVWTHLDVHEALERGESDPAAPLD